MQAYATCIGTNRVDPREATQVQGVSGSGTNLIDRLTAEQDAHLTLRQMQQIPWCCIAAGSQQENERYESRPRCQAPEVCQGLAAGTAASAALIFVISPLRLTISWLASAMVRSS